jgi:hypothetical protein
MTEAGGGDQERQRRSYETGARWAKERMGRERPADAAALSRVNDSDIVVVRGVYDRVEQVLGALELPFVVVGADDVPRLELRPEQLLVVNCPGELPGRALPLVEGFVRGGGSLLTTDWALRHVIEPGFPGLVAYNERPTRDDVVRIELLTTENPLLAGVIEAGDDPQWWLEGSSYPIRVVDPDRVEVLITSSEMAARYGEAAICVRFDWGAGEVLHMVSHYYLQRTELRSARHAMSSAAWADEKGVSAPSPASEDLSLGEVEAAYSSTRFLANLVASKKRRGTATDDSVDDQGDAD